MNQELKLQLKNLFPFALCSLFAITSLSCTEAEREELAKTAKLKEQKIELDISRVSTKEIQTALKNAGFYPRPIDGVMGPQTKEAIRSFQKENGLKADGIIGKKTWSKLHKYLK